ncbi:MAG: Gfo/Idh/MocA family protein [Bacilli bacterium]
MNAAIIGLGDIAHKAYLPFIMGRADIKVSCLMNRSFATLSTVGERFRVSCLYTNVDDVIGHGVDCAFVHTATESHAEIVMKLLSHGVDVYVDKPLAYTLEEAERMVDAAEKCNRILMVGFNRRFAPQYVAAKEQIGDQSTLIIAEKHRNGLQRQDYRITMLDDMIHMIDLLRWFGGAALHTLPHVNVTPQGWLQDASAMVRFAGNGVGFAAMNRDAGGDREWLEVHGNGLTITVEDMAQMRIVSHGREEVRTVGKWDSLTYNRGFEGAVNHFIQCVQTRVKPLTSGEEALATQRLVETIVKS